MALPTKKQLEFCYDILHRIKECPADENGQPLFETSMSAADDLIKKHYSPRCVHRGAEGEAGDWGGILNH